MTWYSVFDSVFWLSIGGILVGFGGVVINACVKSKCSELNICFGLFKCVRDVKAEVELEEHRIDMGLNPDTPNTPSMTRPVENQVVSRPLST